jgi:hypothetical protein
MIAEIIIGMLIVVYFGMLWYMWSDDVPEDKQDGRTLKFTTK